MMESTRPHGKVTDPDQSASKGAKFGKPKIAPFDALEFGQSQPHVSRHVYSSTWPSSSRRLPMLLGC